MRDRGRIQEVEDFRHMGVLPAAQSMQGLGYKELIPVVKDGQPLGQAVEAIKLGTRHYAKRQMTWFRRTEGIQWLDAQAKDLMEKAMEQIRAVLNA